MYLNLVYGLIPFEGGLSFQLIIEKKSNSTWSTDFQNESKRIPVEKIKKRHWQDSNLRGKTQWISSPSP